MAYHHPFEFTHAIVCRPPKSFQTNAIGIKGLINLQSAREQHADYVSTLESLGLDVLDIPADESLPDCVFVEDTAVVVNGTAFITKPGAPSREKESVRMKSFIQKELDIPIVEISDETATIEGGDVVFTGREFFVGISSRTNLAGANALASAFPEYPCTPVKISGALHIKGLITMVGPDMICASKTTECEVVLKIILSEAKFQYQILYVPDILAANCIYINGSLIHTSARELPESAKVFEKLTHCNTVECNISDIKKAQADLSCCSILIRKPKQPECL